MAEERAAEAAAQSACVHAKLQQDKDDDVADSAEPVELEQE